MIRVSLFVLCFSLFVVGCHGGAPAPAPKVPSHQPLHDGRPWRKQLCIRTLGLNRIRLLGYSFGGELALEYAIAHPDRVERMILQAPEWGEIARTDALQMDAFEAISEGAIHERIREILRVPGTNNQHLEQIWNVVDTETVNKLLFYDPAKAAPMRQLWSESGLRGPNAEMHRIYTAPRAGEPLLWRARGLDVKTLVLVGLYDRNVGVDGPRELSEVLPQAKLVSFDRSAHFPDLEEPAKYADAVRAFLL